MILEKISIDKLNPAKYNPRKDLKPGDKDYEDLKLSIEKFGYVDPLIWNRTTGNIVSGHQRFKILKAQGLKEIDCIVIEKNEAEEKALNIRLNKNPDTWDYEKLSLIFPELKDKGIDLNLTGFSASEISEITSNIFSKDVQEDNFDVDEELKQPIISQLGDLYLLGKHRLVCGDSTQPEVYERLMNGIKANLILTDPPYNVAYEAKAGKIQNDNMADEDFYKFLLSAFSCMAEHLADDGSAYIFYADIEGLNFRKAFNDAGFRLTETCIWKKNQLVMGRLPYHYQHEPILYGWKQKGKHQWYTDRKQTTIWEYDKPLRSELHPTMKPI